MDPSGDFIATATKDVAAVLCCVLFVACTKKDPAAKDPAPETSPRVDAPAQSPGANSPAKTADSTEVRQNMAETEKLLRGGSYDEAAARLLKMRISGVQFSAKDAAAYREALQEAYSRALEAAGKGDPKGKAAVEMIRAARSR